MANEKKTGLADGYLHGFSKEEQDRLYVQARYFEDSIYGKLDFSKSKTLLEVGCGVGAQTEILLERFPNLSVEAIDASPEQLARAKAHLIPYSNRVNFSLGDAMNLQFDNDSFDAAFLCWFLEHVQDPIDILSEVRRVLKPNGQIFCNEVMNATFYIHPYSPATLKYWFQFNDHQWSLKGDPFVGGKLANYLLHAGFQEIETTVITHHYDNRMPKLRAQCIEYWTDLLLSGAPALIAAGRITPEDVENMRTELSTLKNNPDTVFFDSWIQAKAKAL